MLLAPALAASDAGVRNYLDLARRREANHGCAVSPSTSSAIGYYQMTLAALRDIGLKNDEGSWLENEWGITSDEEFQCHRAANDEAMKRFTRNNWAILTDEAKERMGKSAYGVVIDAASLLAGAHFLGARGMNDFVVCGMHVTCISELAVLTNGGDPARIHRKLINRMKEAAGMDVSELADGS
jgi:FMN phosphatase YigB (HAD superfamily)